MNATYLKQLGIAGRRTMGQDGFRILPCGRSPRNSRRTIKRRWHLGHPIEFTEESIGPGGEPCTWLTYKFPFQDASGQMAVGGIGIDITEQKNAREALQALTGRLIHTQEEERARIAQGTAR